MAAGTFRLASPPRVAPATGPAAGTRRQVVKRTVFTKQAPHPWPFSHGTIIEGPGRLVFLAGQIAYDRQGADRKLVGPGDVAAQTRQAIENMRTLLRQAG